MKKFKRTKYPKLKKRLLMVLIALFILFLTIFFWVKVNADTHFAVISGYAWSDENEDGKINEGEPKLSGIEVFLCDANGNEIPDKKTTTNADGYYQFEEDLGANSTYRIKFKYDGLEYTGKKMIKQAKRYTIGDIQKVNVIWNFPINSAGKEFRFRAILNQFQMQNIKKEVFLQYDSNTVYKNNLSLHDSSIILTSMNEAGSLNKIKQKNIFFIYFDGNTVPPGRNDFLKKLKEIKSTIDDNDYHIISYFSNDFADQEFKKGVENAALSSRIEVIADNAKFESALQLYLQANQTEEKENNFGQENQEKRVWITENATNWTESEMQQKKAIGETKIEATSNSINADEYVYVCIDMKPQTFTPKPEEEEDTSADGGTQVVKGKVFEEAGGNKIPIEGVKVELLDAGGTVRNWKTTDNNGSYCMNYPEAGTYVVRFTYGQNQKTQNKRI